MFLPLVGVTSWDQPAGDTVKKQDKLSLNTSRESADNFVQVVLLQTVKQVHSEAVSLLMKI